MEIVPGIYQLTVPIPIAFLDYVNCYLIEGKDGWLMVDTGWYTPDTFDFVKTELKGLGLSLSDIATIIVTHVHPDHFGLAGRIKQVSPATRLLVHCCESSLIESRYIKFSELQAEMESLLQRYGVPSSELSALLSASMPVLQFVTAHLPDRTLYGGEIISTGKYDLEVIWTPGHSPGHVCLYEAQHKLLFSGDHVLPVITPNISYHVQSGDNPLGDYVYALRKIQNLPVDKVLPAHGQVFTNLSDRITEIVNHHNHRKIDIQKIIKHEALNAYDISRRISWNIAGMIWNQFPPLQKRLAIMETIAHLECLRWEGKVEKIVASDGLISYQTL